MPFVVSELELSQFCPLSREPFKDAGVRLAAGVAAPGEARAPQGPPSPRRPSPPAGPLPPREAAPCAPSCLHPGHSCGSSRSGARQSRNWEADLWSVAPRLLCPPAPPPPAAGAWGAELSRGRGRSTSIPLPPALPAFQIQLHLLLF